MDRRSVADPRRAALEVERQVTGDERLRALDPDVAVVFATGYSEEQIDVGFVLREQVPVVTKPYERAALLSAIAQVTLRRRMADCDVSSPA